MMKFLERLFLSVPVFLLVFAHLEDNREALLTFILGFSMAIPNFDVLKYFSILKKKILRRKTYTWVVHHGSQNNSHK